ncbi:hypothetical protein CBL_05425 [Carabus blaptoides fortunei]
MCTPRRMLIALMIVPVSHSAQAGRLDCTSNCGGALLPLFSTSYRTLARRFVTKLLLLQARAYLSESYQLMLHSLMYVLVRNKQCNQAWYVWNVALSHCATTNTIRLDK